MKGDKNALKAKRGRGSDGGGTQGLIRNTVCIDGLSRRTPACEGVRDFVFDKIIPVPSNEVNNSPADCELRVGSPSLSVAPVPFFSLFLLSYFSRASSCLARRVLIRFEELSRNFRAASWKPFLFAITLTSVSVLAREHSMLFYCFSRRLISAKSLRLDDRIDVRIGATFLHNCINVFQFNPHSYMLYNLPHF